MRGGCLMSRVTGNQTQAEDLPLGEIPSLCVLTAEGCGGEF